ncbi:MAG: hypothetical protein FWD18_00010 [Micrococcales bacterium]|nr:hypothetical protein [Micrococcales bacterium]
MGVKTTWSGLTQTDRDDLQEYYAIRDGSGDLLGRMKLAAIDAYMTTNKGGRWATATLDTGTAATSSTNMGFPRGYEQFVRMFPNGFYHRNHYIGDDYVYVRPDARGRGGGEAYKAGTLYQGEGVVADLSRAPEKDLDFDGIRRRIDRALEPFWDLPATGSGTGGDFGPATEIADDLAYVAGELGLSHEEHDSRIGGSGHLESLIGQSRGGAPNPSNLYAYTNDQGGNGFLSEAFMNWRTGFVQKMPKVVGSYAWIAMWLATTTAAQARGWHVAKADVARAVETARANFSSVAFSGGFSEHEAQFMKAAVLIAEAYLPKPLSAISTALGAVDYANGAIDGSTRAPDSSYDSTMRSFESSLKKISAHIEGAETDIANSATSLLREVRGSNDRFQLRHDQRGGDISIDTTNRVIDLRYAAVRTVSRTLDEVIEVIRSSASDARAHEESVKKVFRRDLGVGLGKYGPGWAVQEVAEMLGELLRNLAFQCEASQGAIWAVFWDHIRNNENAASEFRTLHPEAYQYELPQHPDPRAELDVYNAALGGEPPERPFDFNIKELERLMGM